jgi:hypothetical protein
VRSSSTKSAALRPVLRYDPFEPVGLFAQINPFGAMGMRSGIDAVAGLSLRLSLQAWL